MFFTCLRAAEFILLSFLPSLICSFAFGGASGIFSAILTIGAFLFLAFGMFYLGYILMSTIGNRNAYIRITGSAFGIFAAISAGICFVLGAEGNTLLTRALTLFMPFETSIGLSVLFSLLLLAIVALMPGFIYKKNLSLRILFFRRFYKDAESRYRHSRRRHSSRKYHHTDAPKEKSVISENKEAERQKPVFNEEGEEVPPNQSEMDAWLEHERKRREYEARFKAVKPAKFVASNGEEEDEQARIERKIAEKEARLQQYFTEANKKTHPEVDREAELKKARELAEELDKRRYHSHYKHHSHHETKDVDREAELKKARELQLQLEYEEEQKLKELFGKR